MAQRVQAIAGHLSAGNMQGSRFADTPLAPPDAIFNLTASYKKDAFDKKVNLGVGAYRDDKNKPWVLPVVKKATDLVHADPDLDHEYLGITGLTSFTEASAKLMFGKDSKALNEKRIVSAQTISGTGANHLGSLFLSRHYKFPDASKAIYISNPTWANHKAINGNVGLTVKDYPYYDPKTIGLDFEGFTGTLRSMLNGSVVLLHACAHNPTGVDPTIEQWKQIAQIMKEKNHFPYFDCAYQGFASGDLVKDGWAVQYFEQQGFEMVVCQSFAKNFGLYGERAGCLHIVTKTPDAAKRVNSQVSVLQRSEISNPPAYGARIVSRVLNDPALFAEWQDNIKTMSYRIIDMRKRLHDILTNKLKTPPPQGGKNWDHIINQIGMFSFTGLNPDQVKSMVNDGHVYMTGNGRVSMAGLTTTNVEYVAQQIDRVVRK